ncbi:MAG: molecular chaperone TorD family protein, partial [Myxococcota bacterium]
APALAAACGLGSLLLGELLARGRAAELLEAAHASEALAATLGDLERAAADHHHVFDFALHPYAGVFLSPQAQVGGACTDALQPLYARAGVVAPSSEGPEHLATLCRVLAHLAGAEADALADGAEGIVAHLRGLQRTLLDEHLLAFFPPLAAAVARVGRPFPSALFFELGGLLALHREALGGAARPLTLPETTLDLADAGTGLGEIAAHLTTPCHAGAFLGRHELGVVARRHRLPKGFGGRALQARNLLRAAVRFGVLPAVLDELVALLEAEADLPEALAPFAAPWRARAQATRRTLAEVSAAAARFEAEAHEDAPGDEAP